MTDQNYFDALEEWKVERLADLKAPNGWLNIIGRWVLEIGDTSFGTAEENDIVTSTGPAHAGVLRQTADHKVSFIAAGSDTEVPLEISKYAPPRFTVDNLLCEITSLNGEQALRIRDTASTASQNMAPIEYFEPKPEWRKIAKWVKLDTPEGVTVNTSGNILTDVEVSHKAVFEHDGVTYELLATHGTPARPQFVIRDLTSKDETYAASRFIFGEDVYDGTVVVDFNKAINPPCSYTDFAVCPLPPAQNILPIRVEAGEKKPKH